MTLQEIENYYADLLILQYKGKHKAYATIQLLAQCAVMNFLPGAVQSGYNIDPSLGATAVGTQLDIIGKIVGVSRNGYDFTGPVTLSDADFLTLIKLKIMSNNSSSTLAAIQTMISIYFKNTLYVFDYQNMQLDYFFDSSVASQSLAQFVAKQGLLPRPMGVQLGAIIYASNINNFFGMRTYALPAYNVTGFNSYANFHTTWPWLSYANAIQ
jgi:hypothetical protein